MHLKQVKVKFRKLSLAARIPAYATAHAAGLDLCATLPAPVRLGPGKIRLIPTGIAVEIPPGYEGQVRPRSGLALKSGISIVNAPGTIDADYRGEVGVILINLGGKPFTVNPGDRIAQLVISPVARAQLKESGRLKPSARGRGGFGHTGVGRSLTRSLSHGERGKG